MMVEEHSLGYRITNVTLYTILALTALLCLLPFVHMIALSLSDAYTVKARLISLWPIGFNLDNYRYLTRDQQFIQSFGTSVIRVLVGVTIHVLVTVITAYPLSLDNEKMPGRKAFKLLLLFAMMFSGGLIPYFLTVDKLGLLNHFSVLVIPSALGIFNVILVMNFFRGIPVELREAATIDGATHLDVLFRIYVPVSLPSLATITLFSAVWHWNSWFDGILFLSSQSQWPLQSYLYSKVNSGREGMLAWRSVENIDIFRDATPEGLSAALILIATIPIMMVYPFLQRYFVTGLTLGSVKE